MKVRRALVGFSAITLLYLAVLIGFDSSHRFFSELPKLVSTLPVLTGLSLLSYVVRYVRWYWLLGRRAGNRTNVFAGGLAYLAGFAFTATPGKVGELVRIRYLAPRGVPPRRVLAAFIYERAWSLASLSFAWLLSRLGVSLPLLSAAAIYPLAMLAGAVSMLPGGIGSTETVIVALLSFFDVPLGTAVLAAVGIRFSSMWFAVLCGFVALGALESLPRSVDDGHVRIPA